MGANCNKGLERTVQYIKCRYNRRWIGKITTFSSFELTYRTIAMHVISMGFRFDCQNVHASRKIGVTKTTRRIPWTFQVAGFATLIIRLKMRTLSLSNIRCHHHAEHDERKAGTTPEHHRHRLITEISIDLLFILNFEFMMK